MANGLMLPVSRLRERQGRSDTVTANKIGQIGLYGMQTHSYTGAFQVATDTTEANSTTKVLNLTSHVAKVGDMIRFTSGANDDIEAFVESTTTNTVTLAQELPTAPGTDSLQILRFWTVLLDTSGRPLISGASAHDSAVSGNPLLLGVEARATNPSAVSASADVARVIADMIGRIVVAPYTIPQQIVTGASAADIVNTTASAVIAAQGAGIITYITSVEVINTSATVTRVDILDGSTIKAYCHVGAAAGSVSSVQLNFPVPLRGTANTAWNVQCATTATVTRASMTGFTSTV